MNSWLNSANMTNNPAFEYDDDIHDNLNHEFVGMLNSNIQPEESVQSSSQADNEESVSLRVNPTYAQDVQEDLEFSKLLSRYSPEDIISMLSKHTVRAAASPSPPSPSPFHASSSRPAPRPVTPSGVTISLVPISTPNPSTPLPASVPTPPFSYPPNVQPTPPAQSESISRSDMEGLVRRLLAESMYLSKPHSLQNYCKLPNAYFPLGFKAPKYRKYDGTSDPQFHFACFTMDSHRWLYDRVLLVHLFQQLLEGEALRWFTSLPASDLINFNIVSKCFISHFSYMATQIPTLSYLVAEKMRPDEDFVTFANRWRSMASRADVTIPESQVIIMICWVEWTNIFCKGSVDTTILGVDTMVQNKGRNVKKRTNIFCKGSVDTTILGVDTMVQNKGRNVKKSPSQVDTSPEQKVDTESSQVDTRDLSQGFVLPVWESVSTHLMGRSTHSGISVT
ncbi:hypothetical protein Taro_008520 [Colocasia esculenta]|uniref:Retrotransposon gag domain-containing protein n=1 Tax=Colocasia esculenta TaxID=4460 RepID=A0A843U2J8_COLES|nr:hypothetical protein [Colocasia esculenta]